MSAEIFTRVRRLMLHESWENPTRASVLLSHMIDTFLHDSTSNGFPAAAAAGIDAATGTAFFEFIAYFASALTAQHMLRSGATHSAAESPRRDARFPPMSELWRQPSLLAALEAIAAAVWAIQSCVHGPGDALLCCPLCYAAGVDHTAAAGALWALLEFHAAHRVHGGGEIERGESEAILEARRMVWTHAVAVSRNAVWNGAARAARQCVEEWIFAPGAPHAALFAPTHADFGDKDKEGNDAISSDDFPPPAVHVGGDVYSLRGFILTQCCLLAQDEVAAANASARSPRDCDPCDKNDNQGSVGLDEDVISSLSSSTIGERGDVELCASMLALRDSALSLGSAEAFAAVATSTPLHCADGAPLLHWACETGRAASVRLMLVAWLDAYDPRRRRRKQRDGYEENETFEGGEENEEHGHDGECSTRYLRVDFASELDRRAEGEESVREVNTSDVGTMKNITPSSTRAIRCTPLHVPVGPYAEPALSFALRSGNVSIVKQLLLFGATHHIPDPPRHNGTASKVSEMSTELVELLRDPGAVLDPGTGPLHARLRTALCASAAADTLAATAERLWTERARDIGPDNAVAYHRAHDGVLRLALAAMDFDPHCTTARATLREVLARKSRNQSSSRRYLAAVRRMSAQLSRDESLATVLSCTGESKVSGGGASPATIATDERRRAAFALVNCSHGTGGDVRPLWVRLPRGIDVERSLRAAGGLYGVVDGPVSPAAPFERGDLILFALREREGRFDATRIVRPRDGAVVDVPCVRARAPGAARVRLRCAMAPAPVFAFDEDRAAADPLQWMDTARSGSGGGDAVERVLDCQGHTARWDDARRWGQRGMWLREISPGRAPVWCVDGACEGMVFAAAEFPAPAYAEVDDPFGAAAEAVFVVRRHSAEAAAMCGAAFRVAGVLPTWGWE